MSPIIQGPRDERSAECDENHFFGTELQSGKEGDGSGGDEGGTANVNPCATRSIREVARVEQERDADGRRNGHRIEDRLFAEPDDEFQLLTKRPKRLAKLLSRSDFRTMMAQSMYGVDNNFGESVRDWLMLMARWA